MRLIGLLAILGVVAFAALEVFLLILAGIGLNRAFEAQIGSGGWLVILLYLIAMVIIGIKLAKAHAARIPAAFFTGNAGAHVMGAVGAVLLAIPGLLTDVVGLLLLLPPIQKAFSKLGSAILAVLVKRFLGKAMGGGMAGLGGLGAFAAMGGMGGGGKGPANPFAAFPGMKPVTPDDRVSLGPKGPKGPKTYDTTAER